MDYLTHLQHWLEQRGDQEVFPNFKATLKKWQRSPYPVEDFYAEVTPLLGDEPHLLEGLKEWLPTTFAKVIAKAEKARLNQTENERTAYEVQSGSPLLRLPRELRDKIWDLVTTENVIHVSEGVEYNPKRRGRAARRKKYFFHMCSSERGQQSVACPPGVGDHALCSTSGENTYGSWRAVCKQMYFETPALEGDILSKNALQFADLEMAEQFLFGLKESTRASITHLRLALPSSLVHGPNLSHWDTEGSPWHAICNYFSNPWDRKTLHMEREKIYDLKKPIYFYYSSCYYEHNSHRLYKTWQVGRGGSSWDVNIADMVYKGCPRLDLALADPSQGELERYGQECLQPIFTDFSSSSSWIVALLQFRNYDGLKFDHYSLSDNAPDAVKISEKDNETRAQGIKDLKDFMRGGPEGVQGPQICAFFAGRQYGSGDGLYNYG